MSQRKELKENPLVRLIIAPVLQSYFTLLGQEVGKRLIKGFKKGKKWLEEKKENQNSRKGEETNGV